MLQIFEISHYGSILRSTVHAQEGQVELNNCITNLEMKLTVTAVSNVQQYDLVNEFQSLINCVNFVWIVIVVFE